MILSKLAIQLSERGFMPDFVIRAGIRHLCKQRLIEISASNCEVASDTRSKFFQAMKLAEIAPLPEMANANIMKCPQIFLI